MTGHGGGKIAKTQGLDSTLLKAEMEPANPVVYVERKCSSFFVLFFLAVVVTILSSAKKHPHSRWNQSPFLSFRSSVGKSLCKEKEKEREWGGVNGLLRKMTQRISVDVFHLFFSSLFPSLYLPYLHILCSPAVLSTSKLRGRSLFPLLFFQF